MSAAVLTVPGLVCLLGLLVYALAGSPKAQELGRLGFFAGLLVVLLELARRGLP